MLKSCHSTFWRLIKTNTHISTTYSPSVILWHLHFLILTIVSDVIRQELSTTHCVWKRNTLFTFKLSVQSNDNNYSYFPWVVSRSANRFGFFWSDFEIYCAGVETDIWQTSERDFAFGVKMNEKWNDIWKTQQQLINQRSIHFHCMGVAADISDVWYFKATLFNFWRKK